MRATSILSHPLRLVHVRGRISYPTSLWLQEALLRHHWVHRAALKQDPGHTRVPPPPYLLSFTTEPTYTVGRRHLAANPLSPAQISYLTRDGTAAAFHPTSRGGLLTYHGPGQLTAYPIIDLRRWKLSARCYVKLLEDAVISVCNSILPDQESARDNPDEPAPRTGRSPTDPGIWMRRPDGQISNRKICALGVQVTRGVTTHGIGFNVQDEPIEAENQHRFPFDDQMSTGLSSGHNEMASVQKSRFPHASEEKGYLSWGFGRVVACGLEGKSTTWLSREGYDVSEGASVETPTRPSRLALDLAQALTSGLNRQRSDIEHFSGTVQSTVLDAHSVEALARGEARNMEEAVLGGDGVEWLREAPP